MMDLFATVTCIVALTLSLFAELGGCMPDLIFDRRSQLSTSPDRNVVDLFCSEEGSETMATFWNGNALLNSIPSTRHTHVLTPETEAGIVCRNHGVVSNEIRLAALPEEQNLQDQPPRLQCVRRRGGEVELTCDYPPGTLRELYSVRWRFRKRGNAVPESFSTTDLPFGNLRSIDEDTFALTVAVEQSEDQFYCEVNVQRNGIDNATVQYVGATIELIAEDQIQIRKEVDTSTEAVLEGDGAQFYCAFDGNPAPTIKWKLNDDEVQNGGDSGRFIISSFSLEFDCIMTVTSTFNILFTKAQDNGLVECEATNTNSEGTQFTAASNTSLTVHMHSDRPTTEVESNPTFSPNSNGSLVKVISVSAVFGVLVIILLLIIGLDMTVLIARRRKKVLTHDNQHIYESITLFALETQYNITLNDAYVPGTSASAGLQNATNAEKHSSTASDCSHEAFEGDEMRESEDQSGSGHEHERDASVSYQAGDDYEQAQCYELAGGAYDQFRGQDYEQTSDPYERVQDYEQQQASDTYDQIKGQDYEQTSDPYERVQDYEQQQGSGAYDQVQIYERLQVSDQVEDNEQLQASGACDRVQSVTGSYCV